MSYETLVAEATSRPDGPTKKQIDFVLKLAGERRDDRIGSDGEERIENVAARIENGATRKQVSVWISTLLTMPIDDREKTTSAPAPTSSTVMRGGFGVPQMQVPAPRVAPEAKTIDPTLTPGVYDVDGHVYVVKFNQGKTRLYAKHIVESPDRLNANGDLVDIDFVYKAGAIFKIKPEHKMALEDAKVLTIRYGRCMVCGRRLKAGKSVEQGIGPVCIKSFA